MTPLETATQDLRASFERFLNEFLRIANPIQDDNLQKKSAPEPATTESNSITESITLDDVRAELKKVIELDTSQDRPKNTGFAGILKAVNARVPSDINVSDYETVIKSCHEYISENQEDDL